jgi:YD repeat-containing protein
MHPRRQFWLIAALWLCPVIHVADAQTLRYHLHVERSAISVNVKLLTSSPPDTAAQAIASFTLQGQAAGDYEIQRFVTDAGDPGVTTTLPTGAAFTLTAYMRKTANYGTLFPKMTVGLNGGGTTLCSATGASALTTTVIAYTLTCTLGADLNLTSTNTLYLWVGVTMTVGPGNHAMSPELSLEGVLDGNYDSRLATPLAAPPPPVITSLSPATGPPGQFVTMTGSNFGINQGRSTVKFNGVTALVNGWSATSIVATVPATATTGPVVVTVGDQSNAGTNFDVIPNPATTYRLHRELSGPSYLLSTTNPDAALLVLQSTDFKNQNPLSAALHNFVTANNVPSLAGTIPAGSAVVFNVWMRKTANYGTFYPRAWLYLNDATGTSLCQASGTTALTTTFVKYSFSCPTPDVIGVTASDRWFAQVGINMTAGPGTKSVIVETGIEGTLNGNYDSTVSIPGVVSRPPVITSLNPTSGPTSTTITISGRYFGSTQGTSTLRLGNTVLNPTSWLTSSVTAPVPMGAVSGLVTVTVAAQPSNGMFFALTSTGSLTGIISRASNGTAVSGAVVEALQAGVVKSSVTSAANGQYATPTLSSGTYSLRVTAAGFAPEIVTSVTVGGGTATTVNVSLATPGQIAGQITSQSTGLAGAAVAAMLGTTTVASVVADASGNYVLSTKPGTYTVEASAPGYSPSSQSGVSLAGGGSATVNLALTSVAPADVRYVYDELGRLTSVIDPSGGTAVYAYDAVGNILSISRYASSAVTVVEFSPNAGVVGTTVTISGTGFSATPSQNLVNFNGTAAAVVSATTTELRVTVPAGASTGAIGVTAPSGSATSAASFSVLTSTSGPSIIDFSPRVAAPGDSVAITGSGFLTSPALRVNFSPAAVVEPHTGSTLNTVVPAGARSGPVTVATPYGVVTSAAYIFVPPAPWTAADVDGTAVLQVGVPVVLQTAANKISLAAFAGVAGERVSLQMDNLTSTCGMTYYLYDTADDPWVYGTVHLGNPDPVYQTGGSGWTTAGTPLRVLPTTRSYHLMLDPCNTQTSQVRVTLRDVPPDLTAQATVGGPPVTVTTTDFWQNALFKFAGIENRRVSILLQGPHISSGYLQRPNDTNGFNDLRGQYDGSGFGVLNAVRLPATTTYNVFANPDGAGPITITIYDVPEDLTSSIAIGGSAVTVANTAIGQNVLVSFSGSAQQQVSLRAQNCPYGTALNFRRTDATALSGGGAVYSSDWFINPFGTLPETGTFVIQYDPQGTTIGSCTLTLTQTQ